MRKYQTQKRYILQNDCPDSSKVSRSQKTKSGELSLVGED